VTEARVALDRLATPIAITAIRSLRVGNTRQAVVSSDRYIEIVPWQDLGYLVRAQAFREQGQLDRAVADYIKAFEAAGYVRWLQEAFLDAGLLKGDLTGEFDQKTRELLPSCVKEDRCFELMKKAVPPRFDRVQKLAGE
jgi:hypothetical protein